MALKEIAPWRWGGLRRWEDEGRPFESFMRDMNTMRSEMDRLFDSLIRSGGTHYARSQDESLSGPWSETRLMPRIDEREDDKAYYVEVELPGMDKDDVDITLSNGMLTIRGEKKRERERELKGGEYYRSERAYGAFRRTLPIPAEVDESDIDASFEKGILHIELPKSEEARKQIRHIDIKAA